MTFKATPKDKAYLYTKLKNYGCVKCHGREFFAGPRGGMTQNFLCCDPECRMEFNMAPVVGFAEQTGVADQERFAFFQRFPKIKL